VYQFNFGLFYKIYVIKCNILSVHLSLNFMFLKQINTVLTLSERIIKIILLFNL